MPARTGRRPSWKLTGGGAFSLLTLYGAGPYGDASVTGGCATVPEPDLDHVRELVVDGTGHVFTVSTQAVNANDWLLV